MRFFVFFTLAVIYLSAVQADHGDGRESRLDLEDLDINGIEVLRKVGIGDDHIVIDIPKPDVHYYASEPVPIPPTAEAEEGAEPTLE